MLQVVLDEALRGLFVCVDVAVKGMIFIICLTAYVRSNSLSNPSADIKCCAGIYDVRDD